MPGTLSTINWIDSLEVLIDRYDLSAEEFCLVGSASLAAVDLRENGDLDVCFAPSIRESIDVTEFEGIETAPNKYEHIGISDEEILSDDRYHDVVGGFKIIRPEIEYSHKKIRQWEKDIEDIELLEAYKSQTDSWDQTLEVDDYTVDLSHLVHRGVHSLQEDGLLTTLGHGITYLRWHGSLPRGRSDYSGQPTTLPGKAVRSLREDGIRTTLSRGVRLVRLTEPTGLLDRYSGFRRKVKLGTLVDRELELRYPTAKLFEKQYDGETFTRMDIVVRLLAVETLRAGDEIPAVVSKFAEKTGTTLRADIEQYLETWGNEPVTIGYDSSILDANALACAFARTPESVPVRIQSGTTQGACSREWFNSVGFSHEHRQQIETRFAELLYQSNAMFPFMLWPPAQQYREEILSQLQAEKRVHFTTTLELSEEAFESFIWALYESQDDLDPKHIQTKLDCMAPYEKVITIGGVEVPNPRIREGFSNEMIKMKERVREKFTPRLDPDSPEANLLIHAADNYDHNRETWEIVRQYTETDLRDMIRNRD
ncbi:hypothetical protein [Halorubrum pallidum]|uniref:Polymerase nucleotidyl transferase domain-containing protein n=1 Tax=Halorubrum pallidum TaxID=1526114 RepID=A0ABD5T213_9EURY